VWLAGATDSDHGAADASAVAIAQAGLVNPGNLVALLCHTLPLYQEVLIHPQVSDQVATDMQPSGAGKQLIDVQRELVCGLMQSRLRQGFFSR